MNERSKLSRRSFLRLLGLGGLAVSLPGGLAKLLGWLFEKLSPAKPFSGLISEVCICNRPHCVRTIVGHLDCGDGYVWVPPLHDSGERGSAEIWVKRLKSGWNHMVYVQDKLEGECYFKIGDGEMWDHAVSEVAKETFLGIGDLKTRPK